MCEGTATGCTKCSSLSILNLATKTCETSCATTTITIDSLDYCREAKIFVDPTSASTTELGTMNNPYKTIDQAFIEIFNYWNAADAVDIMVLEGTTNKVYFQQRPLIINRKDNVQIMTYVAGGAASTVNANLEITNTEEYAIYWSTRYSLVIGKDYDYIGTGSSILNVEKNAIDTLWYTFVILQADFKIDRFLINNVLKLEDDDFAIVHPISNLNTKTLTIDNSIFINYGTVMYTTTSISFSSTNVEIQTPRLVGGFVFLVS